MRKLKMEVTKVINVNKVSAYKSKSTEDSQRYMVIKNSEHRVNGTTFVVARRGNQPGYVRVALEAIEKV